MSPHHFLAALRRTACAVALCSPSIALPADPAPDTDFIADLTLTDPEPTKLTVGRESWEAVYPPPKFRPPAPSPMYHDPATVRTAPIPADLQGQFPIAEPTYAGVDQLLLLSDRWLVVAVRNIEEVVAEVDRLSKGELLTATQGWEESARASRPNWTLYRKPGELRKQYMAQARENVGERRMDEPAYFAVTSTDDPAYAKAQAPTRSTRALVSLDGNHVPGSHEIDYAHYCYLELPSPLQTGCTYTVTLGNGKAVTFTWDESRSVSRAIKVNQVGYLPDAGSKFAYLGAYLQDLGPMDCAAYRSFEVVNVETGDVALKGPITLREKDPRFLSDDPKADPAKQPRISGEDVYQMDLAGLKAEGTFFIRIPGVGRSWPFRHGADAYGEVFYTALRGLFHQRAAQELAEPYTAWTRKAFHTGPVYESDGITGPKQGGGLSMDRFDLIGATMDFTRPHEHVDGGWYDAADWDRHIAHLTAVVDLLTAVDLRPGVFVDGQLNIPESGNGIPDILDEAEYGLRVWLHSQDERGGISGVLETWTHPRVDSPEPYGFGIRTRWDSLTYAAAAAQYARLVQPYSADLSAVYAESAKRAFAFGIDPANRMDKRTFKARRSRGTGAVYAETWDEPETAILPYLISARVQLFALTQDPAWLEGLAQASEKAHPPFLWRFTNTDYSAWLFSGLALGPAVDHLPADLVAHWRRVYVGPAPKGANVLDGRSWVASNLADWSAAMPYRFSWPRHRAGHIGWGNSVMTNDSRTLTLAAQITGDPHYRDVLINNFDFMLGCNPMGMSWTTGLGFTYPVVFQHEFSEEDGIRDPVPGITVYGITDGPRFYQFRDQVWHSPGPDGKGVAFTSKGNMDIPVWRRWEAHPMESTAKCEFTITETMAPTAFAAAMLAPAGWMPSDALKQRLPRRDQDLYGYWYLP